LLLLHLKKLAKENNRPIGPNSTNLVTLDWTALEQFLLQLF
jgi:hypothetical protein